MIYNGITDNATFVAKDLTFGTDERKVCKVVASDTVALCDSGDRFHGVIQTIERDGGYLVMKQKGYVTLAYSGPPPVCGQNHLLADEQGGVKRVTARAVGQTLDEYLVVQVDEVGKTVTLFLG